MYFPLRPNARHPGKFFGKICPGSSPHPLGLPCSRSAERRVMPRRTTPFSKRGKIKTFAKAKVPMFSTGVMDSRLRGNDEGKGGMTGVSPRRTLLSPRRMTGSGCLKKPGCRHPLHHSFSAASEDGMTIMGGFSLVELSIVLVILGLLVGGILTGQNLIRAAELRSVTTQIAQYRSAVFQFKDKYFAYPGDMPNAIRFWGNAETGATNGNCTNPHTDTGTGTQTCNGNGNGFVAGNSEAFRFWQHLANAGLVEGSYTGVGDNSVPGGTSWYRAIPGENIPALKLNNAGILTVAHARSANGSGPDSWVGADSDVIRNYAFIGGATPGDLNWAAIFTPEELWNIDSKMDDGKPGLGVVSSHAVTTCVTSQDEATSEYALTNDSVICTGLVNMSF